MRHGGDEREFEAAWKSVSSEQRRTMMQEAQLATRDVAWRRVKESF
jgi:hypothetical protein